MATAILVVAPAHAQRYTGADGRLRVALAQQPFSPNGTVPGPRTLAQGGIQKLLTDLGASVRGGSLGGSRSRSVNRMIAGAVRGLKTRDTRK